MSAPGSVQGSQYLSFTLAGVDYAVGILQVREILQYESMTRVPGVPTSVRGVINLRGAVVPVVDLTVKFGEPATEVTKRTAVLIVETSFGGERTVMGVMADSVREVLELSEDETQPPPRFGTRIKLEFLRGMGKTERGLVLLLDLDRVLSAGEGEMGPRDDAAPLPPAPAPGTSAPGASPTSA